jgi:glycerol-1-phosphate dehydrogenase [NAD(P)+]
VAFVVASSASITAKCTDIAPFLYHSHQLYHKIEPNQPKKHAKRLEVIIDNWDKIIQIINEEVPPSSEIEKILKSINAPLLASDIGLDETLVPITFKMTKDIRDKYVLSRLCWDLGVIDEIKF